MEYEIGSVADLITGKNTPNKPKVLQKEFKNSASKLVNTPKVKTPKAKSPQKNNAEEYGSMIKSSPQKLLNSNEKLKNRKSKTPNRDAAIDSSLENNGLTDSSKKNKKIKRKLDLSANDSISDEVTEQVKSLKQNRKEQKLIPDLNESESPKKKKKRHSVSGDDSSITPGNNIVDSDVEEEETPKKLSKNDINAERRIKKKKKDEAKEPVDPEVRARTIFIGNVPIKCPKSKLISHFKKYGKIESCRIRGLAPADPKMSKKVAAIRQEFHPKRNSCVVYIKFVNKEDAEKAEAEDGQLFEGHHLRVEVCGKENTRDENKAIFIGNLSFEAEEDDLWKIFEPCGEIASIRIIRDSRTGIGKGFAYVNFVSSDAIPLVFEMGTIEYKKREMRIKLCNTKAGAKEKKKNISKKEQQANNISFKRHFKKPGKMVGDNSAEGNKEKDGGKTKIPKGDFQGTKFTEKKKKNKLNKGLQQKKKLVKKIAPK